MVKPRLVLYRRKNLVRRLCPDPSCPCSWAVVRNRSTNLLKMTGCFTRLFLSSSLWAAVFNSPEPFQKPLTVLLMQHDNAAASCVRLIHLLFDQLQRHATTVETSIYVKNNPASFKEFANWQADAGFLARLKEAAKHPERPESKKLAKTILNVVSVIAPKIPFTTSARKTAMPKLLAMTYYFALPSIFLTFVPDDVHGVQNLRLSLPVTSNAQFPAIDDGFLEDLRQGRSISHDIPVSKGHCQPC